MSQSCAIVPCQEQSRVLCHCCKQNLCLEHLSKHQTVGKSQSNSLIEQIQLLHERVRNVDVDQWLERDRRKLDKWRDESMKKIHRYHERKCDELERFLTEKLHQQEQEIEYLQRKLIHFNQYQNNNDNDVLHQLPKTVLEIEQKIDAIEQNTIPIHIRPFTIEKNFISIGEMKIEEFSLAHLPLPYQTLTIAKHSGYAMSNNEQYLLLDQHPDLALCDRDLIIVERFTWKYGPLRDMCWSLGLASFILITEMNKAYLVNEKNFVIDCIEPMMNQLWTSCTCSNSLLYLVSLNNAVVEFALLPRFSYNRRWEQPDTCQKNETIKDISCSDDTLALVVVSFSTQMGHLFLRSLTTFDLLFCIRLDVIIHPSYQLPIRCCLFKNNQWLVSEANTSRLFHIGKDGQVKGSFKYEQQPYNILVFRSKILAIRTENTINFHQL